jgi:hypothetical protein
MGTAFFPLKAVQTMRKVGWEFLSFGSNGSHAARICQLRTDVVSGIFFLFSTQYSVLTLVGDDVD